MFNLFKKKTPIGKTGDLVESPVDNRDYLLSNYIPEIQRYPDICLPPFDLDILNQGQESSCVGYTCAAIKQEKELREKTYRIFDGSWIYRECKKIDGIPNIEGTFFRIGLQVLKNTGAKPMGVSESPSTYKIASYCQVDDMSFEGLKKAIFLYGTVLTGFRGSNQGWSSEVIRPPQVGENIWGHAVALIGYDKNYLIGQNSWGETAHNKGLFKIPASYLPFEAWVVLVDQINEPQNDIKTGWVAKNYLDINNKTTANLNVREGAGITYKIIKTLPKGTQVNLFGSANKYNDGYWWVEIIV